MLFLLFGADVENLYIIDWENLPTISHEQVLLSQGKEWCERVMKTEHAKLLEKYMYHLFSKDGTKEQRKKIAENFGLAIQTFASDGAMGVSQLSGIISNMEDYCKKALKDQGRWRRATGSKGTRSVAFSETRSHASEGFKCENMIDDPWLQGELLGWLALAKELKIEHRKIVEDTFYLYNTIFHLQNAESHLQNDESHERVMIEASCDEETVHLGREAALSMKAARISAALRNAQEAEKMLQALMLTQEEEKGRGEIIGEEGKSRDILDARNTLLATPEFHKMVDGIRDVNYEREENPDPRQSMHPRSASSTTRRSNTPAPTEQQDRRKSMGRSHTPVVEEQPEQKKGGLKQFFGFVVSKFSRN